MLIEYQVNAFSAHQNSIANIALSSKSYKKIFGRFILGLFINSLLIEMMIIPLNSMHKVKKRRITKLYALCVPKGMNW